MKIRVTNHFKERVEERYKRNGGDTLEVIIKRFKEIQRDISKKKHFYSMREDVKESGDIVLKVYDMDVCYVYTKKGDTFHLITFGNRKTHMSSIFQEMLKFPNMTKTQIEEKLESQKKSIPQFSEKSVFKKKQKSGKIKLKAQKGLKIITKY